MAILSGKKNREYLEKIQGRHVITDGDRVLYMNPVKKETVQQFKSGNFKVSTHHLVFKNKAKNLEVKFMSYGYIEINHSKGGFVDTIYDDYGVDCWFDGDEPLDEHLREWDTNIATKFVETVNEMIEKYFSL